MTIICEKINRWGDWEDEQIRLKALLAVGRWSDKQMSGEADEQVQEEQISRWADKQTNRWTIEQTRRRVDEQI